MKQYPSTNKDYSILFNNECYWTPKYDGSNIRCEWTAKHKIFSKFGSRKRLIDENSEDKLLTKSINLINEKYLDSLTFLFKKEKIIMVTLFFEFFGENSFAGQHNENDKHDVMLIGCDLYKKGLLSGNEFHKLFKYIEKPPILYLGSLTRPMLEKIQSGEFEGATFEGVYAHGSPIKKRGLPILGKVKNKAWIEKVKGLYTGQKLIELL